MKTQQRKPHLVKRIVYCVAALLVVTFSYPSAALADEVPPSEPTPVESPAPPEPPAPEEPTPPPPPPTEPTPPPETPTTPPPPPEQGPTGPTGPDEDTYVYNPETGLWENSKYAWNPTTRQTSPKTTPTYSYNPETGRWDTTEWVYDAPSGKYVPNIISVLAPPEDAILDTAAAERAGVNPTTLLANALSSQSVNNTGPDSTNNISDHKKGTGIFDLFYNVFISNTISSTAISGDALVNMNTLAGNALSGDARAISTLINLMQSSWNLGLLGNAYTTFTQSIFGNLFGDLVLNPGNTSVAGLPIVHGDTTINATGNAAIDNTITLEAVSGDATVSNNTSAGNATTGNATAIANLINAINSSIIAGNSFIGMLNIYGSLNGDILLPDDFMATLLASNVVGNLDTSNINNAEVIGNFDNNSTIINDINASANSGDATVDKNTSAGNAATGNANTNVTLLNLTGRQVVGENALLVFVNVLGKWVGMIVNAPTGATSAALGSGITDDSTLTLNGTTNQTITNTVDINATSGDAAVTENTSAGNATSGDAHAAVNILNLNNSQFALTNWFGVLFINVFDTWIGSFGIDTEAGELPSALQTATTPLPPLSANDVQAFRFAPQRDGSYSLESSDEGVAALQEAHILADTATSSPSVSTDAAEPKKRSDWILTAVGVSIAFSLLGTERYLNRRENK